MKHGRLFYPLFAAALLSLPGYAAAQSGVKPPQQGDPAANSEATSPAAKPDSPKLTLTEQQAKSWVDKPIYTSDGKEIGEVASFQRGTGDTVVELHADIGGVLGLGETRVKLSPKQFKLENDRVVLNMTEAEAKDLPKVNM